MKKFILILAIFGLMSQLSAQDYDFENVTESMNKFGVKLGVNFTNISSNPNDERYTSATKFPYIGLVSNMNISQMFTLATELGYNILGANYDLYTNADPISISLGYITIAAVMKAYFFKDIDFNVGAGLQYGYLVYAHHDDLDRMDNYKSSDFDFVFSAGYDFDFGMIIELRYLLGLTNISNLQDIHFSSSIKNHAIQLQFGWMF